MAWNISQDDYNVLKQNNITKYIRLEMLDFEYKVVDEISGNLISMSVNIDAESDLRRSCLCTLVVNDSSFNVGAGSKIWLDRYIRPYVGYVNNWTGQTQWYNQGIYLINAPSWQYDAQTHELSFAGLDLASKLTGMRNGYLEGIPTSIPANSNVRQVMIALLELGGFTKYLISECMDVDGNVVNVPNEIEIPQGGTIWDGISQLRDIIPRYEAFFDINGTFIYQPIPTGSGSPTLVDDDLLGRLVISEQIDNNFENVKNVVEVYGQSLSDSLVAYVGESTWDASTKTLLVDYSAVWAGSEPSSGSLYGFFSPATNIDSDQINLQLKWGRGASTSTLIEYGHNWSALYKVKHLDANTVYVLLERQLYSTLQPSAIAKDTNPDSPFYVNGTVGPIRIVLYGGEYDNITSDALAKERANYELWKRTRLQDSITLTAIPNPWLDVNILISHATRGGLTANQYIIKSISTDYGDGGTQTINAITYYPLYPDI